MNRISIEDWPTRKQALAIISALAKLEEGRHSELDRLSGISDARIVAGRCFMIYGYPELEGGNMMRRINEVYMRPRKAASEGSPAVNIGARQDPNSATASTHPTSQQFRSRAVHL